MKISHWKNYLRHELGTIAVAFALVAPVLFGVAGMSVDVANLYLVKQRLSHAVDAAALAAAAGASQTADINAKVQQFMKLNYPVTKIGAPYSISVSVNGSDITVSANASYKTLFAKALGDSLLNMNIGASSTVTREIIGLEVSMVLDVTGSMADNNNIATLRTAATNFTNILYANAAYSDSVKIGLVPFSASVSVGPYGLGYLPNESNLSKATTTKYNSGVAFVNNPSSYAFDQTQTNAWWGCILERASPQDTQTAPTGTTWKWEMYRYNNSGAADSSIRKQSAAPNTTCNKSYILPLTTNQTTVLNRISKLAADGNTLSNVGMVWGYRLLSPDGPFHEAVSWTDVKWKKVALLMTDGDNNIGDVYSAYGPWTTLKLTDTNLDSKLATTCANMKKSGITVYTVTFTSGINTTTKNIFKNCASGVDKWYDAPTQSALVSAFEQISRELSNIHITQ